MNKYRRLLSAIAVMGLYVTLNAQWSSNIIPYFRDGNAVVVLDNYRAAIAGGHRANDSIRSIFMTDNRGADWGSNLYDVLKPWATSISFNTPDAATSVGYDGTIIRTTDGGGTWVAVAAPGNTYSRHFNSVYFVDSLVGYIAGGWPSDDSVQTILKTSDGGATWNIQRDNLGYWLRSIRFADGNNGMAVGDNGVVLRTSDGGANWSTVAVPGNAGSRNFKQVYMRDSATAFIVGGHKSNDSIQTILKTTDGGATWNVIADRLGPMLNGIDFVGATTAYIVGNKGVILKSTDQGDSWTQLSLPPSTYDTVDLNAVDFYNVDFGVAVGIDGKMLVYNNPLPVAPSIQALAVTDITTTTATLNALVNGNGSYAAVSIQYGITPQLGTNAVVTPDTVFGSTFQQVSANLTSILPNKIYYYQVSAENEGGVNTDSIRQFYNGGCGIPNCSFEFWDTLLIEHPDVWLYSDIPKKVMSYDGSYAVELTTSVVDTEVTAVFYASEVGDGFPPPGGVPISVQPDSLQFMTRYAVDAGDTAFVIVLFRKLSQMIYFDKFPITGSTAGNFVPMSFPLNFPTQDIPDTVLLGFVNSNAFDESVSPGLNSVLAVDDVKLVGAPGNLPNWDFEQWSTDTVLRPESWYSNRNEDSKQENSSKLLPTTDKVSGALALKLQNYAGGDAIGVTTSSNNRIWSIPNFPVGGHHRLFNFYFKFLPENNDTLQISLQMFKAGVVIGGAWMQLDTAVPNYRDIALPIFYHNNNTDIPDSARIDIMVGLHKAYGNSVAYFDSLRFDGFTLPTNVADVTVPVWNYSLYPNPAQDQVILDWGVPLRGAVSVLWQNVSGQVLRHDSFTAVSGTRMTLNTVDLAPGFYLVTLAAEGKQATRKLVIRE